MSVDISAIGQAAGTVLNGLGRAMNSSTSDTNLIPYFDKRGGKYARNANWVQGIGHLVNLGTTVGSSLANAKRIAKQERENPGSTQLQQNKYGMTFSDTDENLNQYQNRRSAYKAIDDEYNDILEQERISYELDPEYYKEYFGTPEQEAENWRQTSRDNAQRFYTPEGYLFRQGIERNFPNSTYNRNTMPYVNMYAPGGDIKTQQNNGMPWGNIMETANQAFDSFAGNVYAPKSMQEAAVRGDSTEDPLSELILSNKRTKQGLNWVRSNNDNTGVNMYTESGLANDIQKYNQLDKVDRLGFGRTLAGNLQASAKGAEWGTKIGGAGLGTLIGGIAGGIANIGSLFQKHRARKKMNEAIERQNNINQSTILHNVNKVGNTLYNNQMANYKAYGGNLYAEGGDLTNGVTQFNEGGTHEENPYGGIPQGINKENGLPNKVEEGEVKYNDFIYSNRLTVPEGVAEEVGLPKSIEGKTFAEAANILQKESSNRPNDKISKQELDIVLGKLKDLQIKVKEQQDQEELAQQNDPMAEHQLDPMQDPAMQDPTAQMDPSMMGVDPTAMGMDPSMMQDPNAMMPPMDPSMMGAEEQPPMDPAMMGMMAYGGRLYNSYAANDKNLSTIQANLNTAQRQNQLDLYTEEEMSNPDFVRLSKNPEFKGPISYTYSNGYRDNDEFINNFIWNKHDKDYTSPYLGFVNSIKPTENNISLLRKLFIDQYSGKPLNYTVKKDNSKHIAKTNDELGKVFDDIVKEARNTDGTIDDIKFRNTVLPYMLDTNFAGFHNQVIRHFLDKRNPPVVPSIETPSEKPVTPNNYTLKGFNPEVGKLRIPEFNNGLRYAPVYGAMEAIANAKENPSYFRANMQEQLPRIEPVYESVYLPYEAADLNYHVNQLRSQEAQALRALSNAGAGPGAIMATAQKYNDAIGQAKAQVADLNWARRREVAARDAQREQFNAQQVANTRTHNSNLDNIEFQNRVKQRENMYDDYKWNRQDRDQSKTALYNSLYNIGTENMYRDERAWMIENGLLGSRMYNPFKKMYPVARDLSYLQKQMLKADARNQEIADREAEIEANLSYLESMIPKEIEDAEALAEYEALRSAYEAQKNKKK